MYRVEYISFDKNATIALDLDTEEGAIDFAKNILQMGRRVTIIPVSVAKELEAIDQNISIV